MQNTRASAVAFLGVFVAMQRAWYETDRHGAGGRGGVNKYPLIVLFFT